MPKKTKKIKSVREVTPKVRELKPRIREVDDSRDKSELARELKEEESEEFSEFLSTGSQEEITPIIRPTAPQEVAQGGPIETRQEAGPPREEREELSGSMIYEIGASLGGNSPRYTTTSMTSEGATTHALRSSEIGDFSMRERSQVLPEDQVNVASELRKQDLHREESNYQISDENSKKRRAAWEGE